MSDGPERSFSLRKRLPRLTVRYELVTPAFAGRLDNKATAAIEASAFKGILRFWWRALAWRRHAGPDEGERSDDRVLRAIADKEALLFGRRGEKNSPYGQAAVRISLSSTRETTEIFKRSELFKDSNRLGAGAGTRYLGYGVVGLSRSEAEAAEGRHSERLARPAIEPGFPFKISLDFFRRPVDRQGTILSDDQVESVIQALELIGLCGGIGARSRRAFGSLRLTGHHVSGDWSAWPRSNAAAERLGPPGSVSAYVERLGELTKSGSNGFQTSDDSIPLLPYSAFGPHSRVAVLRPSSNFLGFIGIPKTGCETWLDALDSLGASLNWYRSYGVSENSAIHTVPVGARQPAKATAEQKFQNPDHDDFFDILRGKRAGALTPPERLVFGAPHNYFSKRPRCSVTVTGRSYQRRASPLLLHVHRIQDEFLFAAIVLPATFWPTDRGGNQPKIALSVNKSPGARGPTLNITKASDFAPLLAWWNFIPRKEGSYAGDELLVLESPGDGPT